MKMMDWKKRIDLCKLLLADVKDMLPDESEEERNDVASTLEGIEQYTASPAFKENQDSEKDIDSWNMLMNTVNTCSSYMDIISDKLFPQPPKYITREDAYGKLLEEYSKAFEEGDETVAGMNINEWMEANRYVIVDAEDPRLGSSSSSEDDGETVNSRTKF